MAARYHKILDKELLEKQPEAEPFLKDIGVELASHAFNNTSHSPERRGVGIRFQYANQLLGDEKEVREQVQSALSRGAEIDPFFDTIISTWFEGHRAGLKQRYIDYLHSHSRVASSFIVGPARFPTARNQKRSDSADKKYEQIDLYRQKSIKNVIKAIMPYGDGIKIHSDDPKAIEKLKSKVGLLQTEKESMKLANSIIRKYFKNGDPSITDELKNQCIDELKANLSISNKAIAKLLAPNYLKQVTGFMPYEFTNLSSEIRRLKKRIEEIEYVNKVKFKDVFTNGIEVNVSEDNKICIFFENKPPEEIRVTLKSHAFKWSRHRIAWVRKLTLNAKTDYEIYISPILEMVNNPECEV